jgi:hypothetical protein
MSSLSAQLSATEQYAASVLQPAVAEADASVAALEAQLSAARALQAQRASDLAKVTEQISVLRARVAELSPPPSGEGRIWSVSDCHCHCSSGAWALEATDSGTYGVCVSSSDKEGANVPAKLLNGQSAAISKRRYDAAKDIRVGDTLYMGDKKRAAVFKGIVTGQTVTGLFRSEDSRVNSFRRRVGERETGKNDFRPLTYEVEMMWEVKWERVGDLTEAAKKALLYSQRRTVRPLSAHPTF